MEGLFHCRPLPACAACDVGKVIAALYLHKALGEEFGDWYFSGDYPTPGGFATVNRAFMNFFERKEGRAYDTLL